MNAIILLNVHRGCSFRLKCCFTSTETVGLLGTGAQDSHLDFHTAPEFWAISKTEFFSLLMESAVGAEFVGWGRVLYTEVLYTTSEKDTQRKMAWGWRQLFSQLFRLLLIDLKQNEAQSAHAESTHKGVP